MTTTTTAWLVSLFLAALVATKNSNGLVSLPPFRPVRQWNGRKSLLPRPAKSFSTTKVHGTRHRKKSRAWTFTNLSADQRKEVIKLVTGLEQRQIDMPIKTDKQWIVGGLDVLAQWARLGEGERAESACTEIVQRIEDPKMKIKAYRLVLHAWCNQLTRLSNGSRLVWTEIARRADGVLCKMESVSRVLEGDDYLAVIQAHAQCYQVASALHVLQKWQSSSLTPTAAAYASVIRCILAPSCAVKVYERMGSRLSPVEMAHSMLEQCLETSSQKPSLQVYNRVLDAWSKTLPLFSKKAHANDDSNVVEQAEWIWNKMTIRDVRSHVLMIYIYCKSGHVEKAYGVWETLLQRLLSLSELDRVDARSFRMLVNALSVTDTMEAPKRIDSILEGMWQLHEAGYDDTAPDVFLYTTAMNAWAKHGEVDSVRSLLSDLESRHQALQWDSLQKDVATYNALIHASSKQADASNAAEEAGNIVKLMDREAESNPKAKPDTITYNTLIDACLASDSAIGRERAEQTLLWMVDEFKGGSARIKPSLKSFSSVMNAWTDSGCPERAEKLLELMEERYRPPALLFDNIIMAYCNKTDLVSIGSSNAAKRAKRLLERMEELFEATGNEALRPTMSLYNAVIRVLSGNIDQHDIDVVRERRDRMYSRVDSALDPMRFTSSNEVFGLLKHLDEVPPLSRAATTRNFNTVIFALGRSGKIWAGQRAEDILNFMLEMHLKRGKKEIAPDIVTFNSVMAAARSSHQNAGQKAEAVLEKLNALHAMGVLDDVKADRVSYNTIMNAYAKSADPHSGTHAEKVFRDLESLYHETHDEALKPNIVSFTTLLNAWAKSGERNGAKRAEQILLRMLKEYKANHNNVKPNTICFNAVIDAWARRPDEGASKRAEMVLQLMQDMHASGNEDVVPNTRTFNVVLYALANSQEEDAPIRAELLLDRMRNEARNGNDAMKPDIVSYSTAISAWAKQGGPVAMNATLMLLEDLFESDVEPDSGFFSSLIYSLTQTGSKEAPTAAETIVMDVKRKVESGKLNMQVDTEIYNAVINCWAKSGERGATARAEEILQQMEDEYAQGNKYVQPNVRTYTSVIDAYAKNRDANTAKHAEVILNRMEDDGRVLPNVHTYTAVIQNYARSDDPSKALHAQAILHRMKEDYARGNEEARPSVVTYNALLNACEFTHGDESDMEHAFAVACETLEEVRSSDYLAPDDITYGTFLGVISKLMPKSDTRNELVELVFKRCCIDGQLGPVVLKKLKDAASVSRYKKLLGNAGEENLPSKWTCNVVNR